MANVNAFLEGLVNYDKENIHPEVIKAIAPYLKDVEFEPGSHGEIFDRFILFLLIYCLIN